MSMPTKTYICASQYLQSSYPVAKTFLYSNKETLLHKEDNAYPSLLILYK